MTFDEFKACDLFQTIIGPYAAPATQAARDQLDAWVKLIYAATSDWKLATFETACRGVIRNMGKGQKPMPEDWRKALESGRGENLPGAAGCDSCKQTGFVYVQMLETATGRTGDFAVPCPKCRQRHPLKDASPRQGWVMMDHRPEPMLTRMARQLGPKGAQYVIDQIDAKVVTMPDDVAEILVAKSCERIEPEAAPQAKPAEATAERETTAQAVAGSSQLIPPADGKFPDGSKIDVDEEGRPWKF